MDEFAKTKIGFTIALLATAFALKPLVDAYGQIGFIFFDFRITIKIAFLITIGLLGIAVYFISLQFISTKQIALFEKVSGSSYALALSVPVVFIILWFLVIIGGWLTKVVTIIPEMVWNILAGLISGIVANTISSAIRKAINKKDNESKQSENRKKELELLSRAEHLIEDGHFDLALLETGKIMEMTLRQAVTSATGESKLLTMYTLIQQAHKLNLLSNLDIEQVNSVRVLRNNANHLESEITKEQSKEAVSVAKRMIKTLSFAKGIAGYNWLKVNRSEAINALRGNNKPLVSTVIVHLWDAWVNRDGAISGEISEFFEVALQNNPKTIIDMFSNNKDQFNSWLNQIDTQMFTDYIGGQVEQLTNLKVNLSNSLKNFIISSKSESDQKIAQIIKNKIESISVREID